MQTQSSVYLQSFLEEVGTTHSTSFYNQKASQLISGMQSKFAGAITVGFE
jgi:hypothetical protein